MYASGNPKDATTMRQEILFRDEERYFLASHTAILQNNTHPILADSKEALQVLVHWVRDFLCRPHQQLGRGGNVCPYTAPAMKRYALWFTAITTPDLNKEDILATVNAYREWFLELDPVDKELSIFKSIIIAFPTVSPEQATAFIDTTQDMLKADFVKNGLMLGQFHESCPEPGLHNSDFRPLQSPVPLLAIRNMVRTDVPFLAHDEKLMEYYYKLFLAKEEVRT